jgi:hypothetical protein
MILKIYLRVFVDTELSEHDKSPVLKEFDTCEFSGQSLTQSALKKGMTGLVNVLKLSQVSSQGPPTAIWRIAACVTLRRSVNH